MTSSMLVSAWMMGLLGGPHCVLMCGAACAGVAQAGAPRSTWALWRFQWGRWLGYSLMGMLAGGTVQGLSWMGEHTAVLRPFWTMLHVAAVLLGLALLVMGRQPLWLDGWSQSVWHRVKPRLIRLGARAPGWLGIGWALMPCGLLYSALLVASLSASAVSGGLLMLVFAMGTTVSLMLGPWLWWRLKALQSGAWGIRLAGAALAAASGWALWLGLTQPTGLWCA